VLIQPFKALAILEKIHPVIVEFLTSCNFGSVVASGRNKDERPGIQAGYRVVAVH